MFRTHVLTKRSATSHPKLDARPLRTPAEKPTTTVVLDAVRLLYKQILIDHTPFD